MTVTLESLKKSVGKKNAKSEVFAWLADLERAAGDLDGALQRVDGGLTLYPDDVAAMIVRAKILFQQEKYEECVQQCATILVKDTFSLAGQKIMGDAYDKLGKIPERNVCYRRFHDMDPLNDFWKEEYDVVESAVAAAVAADMTMPDDDFSMPEEESGLFIKTLEEPESDNSNGFGDSSPFSISDTEEKTEEELVEEGGGLFEKSAGSMGFSLDDDQAGESLFSSGFSDDQESLAPAAQEEEPSVGDDDPFAALAAMLPNSDAAEDSIMEDLTASLDATMAGISADSAVEKPLEEFPVDDNISGNDVTSAMSSFFGLDDDLEAEESSSASSTFEETPVDENASANASMVFGSAAAEDKPMSVDNAFNSIFGEDELPEELPQEKPAPVEDKPMSVDNAFDSIFGDDELPEEKSASEWSPAPAAAEEEALELPAEDKLELPAEEPAADVFEIAEPAAEVAEAKPAEDGALSVDGAFSSIFGDDDDLPEEKPASEWSPAPATAEEESLELPAEDKLELPAEEPAADVFEIAEPAAEVAEAKPAEDGALSVDGAFSSIFGDDDDLPEEKPASEWSLAPATAEESLELPAEDKLELPAEEPTADTFEIAEPAAEVAEPVAEAKPADDSSLSVDGAFSSIFGDDDDLPEEKPVEEISMVEEVETPSEPAITSAMDFVLDDEPAAPAEQAAAAPAPASESSFTVDSAFSSIFGDDDDLPEEKPAEAAAEIAPEETETLAEKVDQAEAELELPSVQKDDASDLVQEMGGAFASMFGDQDDLDLPELNGSKDETSPFGDNDQQATGAAFEEAAAGKLESDLDKSFSNLFGNDDDLVLPSENADESKPAAEETAQEMPAMQNMDSLESEVSGAFKGLFEMDDDSLSMDQDKPSNSGVDFLMSGDSDDEVSAGLINNPDAPLNRGAQEIDESLNTKTLAEIYFDQGLYGKALDIYKDLAQKEPENQEIASRMSEVEKLYREKFGGNA